MRVHIALSNGIAGDNSATRSIEIKGTVASWTISVQGDIRMEQSKELTIIVAEEFSGAFALQAGQLNSVTDVNVKSLSRIAVKAALESRGNFTALLLCKASGEGVILGDALGVRPFYRSHDHQELRVTSSIKAATNSVDYELDIVGAIETGLLGFPLNERTILKGVARNAPAEHIRVDIEGFSVSRYFDWSELELSEAALSDKVKTIREAFRSAIDIRHKATGSNIAFLSGGLDSRSIVVSLIESGVDPITFGFANAGTQDLMLAKRFAREAKVQFSYSSRPPGGRIDWAGLLGDSLNSSDMKTRPAWAWSGDGGSVCAGAVYCTEELIDLFTNPAIPVAEALFERFNLQIPVLLLSGKHRRLVQEEIRSDLERAVRDAQKVTDDRASFTFFALNDQRRHLDFHFENLGANGIHFLLPFYDLNVLQCYFSCALSARLGHKLYMEWFRSLSALAQSTPWQTYPGHEACPLEIEASLENQWVATKGRREIRTLSADVRKYSLLLARTPEISNMRLKFATLLDAFGVREQQGISRIVDVLRDYQ